MGHTINNPVITITIPGTPQDTVYVVDDAASATLDGSRPVVSRPLYGDEGMRRDVKGLFDGTLTIDFNQDYATGRITQIMWNAMMADDVIEVEVKSKSGEISVNNPAWIMECAVESMAPIDGGAGELATGTLTLPIHGVAEIITAPES